MGETLKQYKKRVASSGGKATVKRHGASHMKSIGKKGLQSRWKQKKTREKLKKFLFG